MRPAGRSATGTRAAQLMAVIDTEPVRYGYLRCVLNRRLLAASCALPVAAVAAVTLRPGSWVEEGYALSAEGGISVEAGGRTYAIPTDLWWQSADGTTNGGGRPECLPPTGKLEGPVRFKAVEVETEDELSWRQVVWVKCLA